MKELALLLRVFFGALFRAFFPAVFAEAKESFRDTCEDAKPQPELRTRLRSRVRAQWGRGALAGSALALALICAAGCGTKVYFVPEGDPVRLRKPIRRAAVWVMDENGRPVASKVTLPAGWFALPDPGADTPEAEEPAVAVEPPAFGVAAPEIPAVPAAPAWAPSVRNVNP